MRLFGIDRQRLEKPSLHSADFELEKGDICYITGPSGAGKSLLLRKLYEEASGSRLWFDNVPIAEERSVIDCFDAALIESLRMLSKAGLADAFCALNQPARLSDGQKWRYRLARAMAIRPDYLFIDEFCSSLDRVTAAAVSWNLRKWSAKADTICLLASCHDDIIEDLKPDVVIVKHLSGPADIIRRSDT